MPATSDVSGGDHARIDLGGTSTPMVGADRLGAALDMAPGLLQIKRDDLTGLGAGGNKVRKLEYLCAAAIAEGSDVLVTGGAAQSNHVRMTGAAAVRSGLRCVAVLWGDEPVVTEGNLVLDDLFGIEIVWAGRVKDLESEIGVVCERLRGEGAVPYQVPLGGSSAIGSLGYVGAADEISAEAPSDAVIVFASSSGGTHAGLVAGLGDHARVLGVDVGFGELERKVTRLAAEVAELAGRPAPAGDFSCDPGLAVPYGAPAPEIEEAIRLVARTEGLVLDPVYTGRAMAALIAARRDGRIADDQPVVYLHTGGLPALLTAKYAPWFS